LTPTPTAAATDEPTVAVTVAMEEASGQPSAAIPTEPPSSEPAPIAAYSTALPTAAPSSGSSQAAAALTAEPSNADDMMLHLPDYTLEALLDTGTPQALAFEWLQGDPNLDQYSLNRKLQRFGRFMVFELVNLLAF
jgi:hypothetical protein